jgi:hypothetical protein
MEQLPEIARRTLKRMAAPGSHLEASQVAAFAEQALSPHQRAYVLSHLAACADCREWLRLSLPENLAIIQKSPVPVRSWNFWQSLRLAPVRWAAIVATATVITTAIWVGRLEDTVTPLPGQGQIFRAEPQTSWTAPEPSSPAAAQPKAPAAPKSTPRYLLDPQAITVPQQAVSAAAAPPKEGPNAAELALSMAAAARRSQSSPVDHAAGPIVAEGQRTATSSPAADSALWATGMLAPAPKSAPANTSHAQWMISPQGTLRRSLDGGLTWHDYTLQTGAKLRAVAVFGEQVWVGGSNGTLYFSADSGQRWLRIIPVSTQGRSLAGDVVAIQFSDAHNVLVTASNGDHWITNDSGRSWRVQSP